MNKKFIDYKGFRYYYEYKIAESGVDICLATKDPKEYCNGFYLYSDKDTGSSMAFVVLYHNNPSEDWYVN